MKRSTIVTLVGIAAVGVAGILFTLQRSSPGPSGGTAAMGTTTGSTGIPSVPAADPANATYLIDGMPVALVNGRASRPAAPGSASMVTTRLFGGPATGDFARNGRTDAAVILVQDSGGSGTFYYAAAAIASGTTAAPRTVGTNAVFLGDRIAPQTVEVKNGVMIVNYADRAAGQPMSTAPSVGKTAYFVTDGTSLYEAPIAAAYPLYAGSGVGVGSSSATGISWATPTPVFATTTPSLIGVEIVSQPIMNITDLATPSTPFMNHYRRALTATGWTVDNMLAAGGPGAEITGYTKGSDYFIVSYTSDFKVKSADAPEQCPCDLTFSLFAGKKMN